MPRAFARYAVLAVLMICACWVRGSGAWTLLKILRNSSAAPDLPLGVKGASRIIAGTDLNGDQILAIDGKPFSYGRQFDEAVYSRHPGDNIRLTLSQPDGSAFEREITIPSMAPKVDSFGKIAVDLAGDILIPLVALFLGGFAVAVRPTDRNAWILLFLMIAFTELSSGDFGLDSGFAAFWHSLWGDLWPFFMMLFGICFPDRSGFDRKRPWVKYLVLIPCLVADLSYIAIVFTWTYDIDPSLPFRSLLVKLYFTQTALGMLAIGTYFANISMKARMDPSADSRRRLRILAWGSSISLTPIFLIAVYSLATGNDLFYGVPTALVVVTLLLLTLFPLTLAYVIVVERAMDLRFVIRQSLQYGLVKGGLWLARAVLISIAVYLFSTAGWSGKKGPLQPIELTGVGVGLLMLRKRAASRASQWVDRRFFRESYDAEKLLSELAGQVGRYVQIQPLLETVAARVSSTLHTPDIVILLRDGDKFIARYSTRPGQPMNIAATGTIAKTLRERGEAVEIYFDKPPLWLRSLTAEELQTLDYMRTQLLLPLTANETTDGYR